MNRISIRKMRQEDLPDCMAILEGWNMAPRPPSDDVPEPERAGIEVANGFVAEADGRIVGTCSYIVHSAGLAETASLADVDHWIVLELELQARPDLRT